MDAKISLLIFDEKKDIYIQMFTKYLLITRGKIETLLEKTGRHLPSNSSCYGANVMWIFM